MKAKCLSNAHKDLTKNKVYEILQVDCFVDNDIIKYRLLGDEGFVIYIPSEDFEITSSIIPDGFTFRLRENKWLSILPKEWVDYKPELSFWEGFYDSEKQAYQLFTSVLDRLGIEVPKIYEHGGS